jgi:hypothetical protein
MQSISDASYPDPTPQSYSWYRSWLNAITSPKESTYLQLMIDPRASTLKAAGWIFISTLISYSLSAIGNLSTLQSSPEFDVFGEIEGVTGLNPTGSILLVLLCLPPVGALISVFTTWIQTAVVQFVAGAFGGTGSVRELYYVGSAISAPIVIIIGALGMVPLVKCLVFPILLFTIYLNIIALKSVNQFSIGKALLTHLLLGLLIFAIGAALAALFLGPLLSDLSSFVP